MSIFEKNNHNPFRTLVGTVIENHDSLFLAGTALVAGCNAISHGHFYPYAPAVIAGREFLRAVQWTVKGAMTPNDLSPAEVANNIRPPDEKPMGYAKASAIGMLGSFSLTIFSLVSSSFDIKTGIIAGGIGVLVTYGILKDKQEGGPQTLKALGRCYKEMWNHLGEDDNDSKGGHTKRLTDWIRSGFQKAGEPASIPAGLGPARVPASESLSIYRLTPAHAL